MEWLLATKTNNRAARPPKAQVFGGTDVCGGRSLAIHAPHTLADLTGTGSGWITTEANCIGKLAALTTKSVGKGLRNKILTLYNTAY